MIRDFGFVSYVSSIKNEIFEVQFKLKRVPVLIAAYEKIVGGNNIDNLVKSHIEQDKHLDSFNIIK